MKVERKSLLSGITTSREIDAPPTKIRNYLSGRDTRHVQDVFPELSAYDREFMMTGITKKEWDAEFPPDEEYDVNESEFPEENP